MVGLTNALEHDGFISGFMGFYLKMVRWAEPLLLPWFNVFQSKSFIFTCLTYIKGLNSLYDSLQGEPHLSAAYAVMMSYWEGVIHFVLFLTIIHRMFNG